MPEQMTQYFIRPTGPRPDFRLVLTFLWNGDIDDFDTDGDSYNAASREWTELYGSLCRPPYGSFVVSPESESPLVLGIRSESTALAARVAYFLASETGSPVGQSESGPWHEADWLLPRMGRFDVAEATARAAQSSWRRSTLENPYPNLDEHPGSK